MQFEFGECYESVNDALKSAVAALGGVKKIGPKMRPEMTTEQAAQWLRDCTNPDRRERLSPEQVLMVLRLAREAGFHAAMDYVAFDCGYKAQPVDPVSQEAELQGRFIDAVAQLAAIQSQMQRAQQRMRAVS